MESKDLIRMEVMSAAAVLRGKGKVEYEGMLFENGDTERDPLLEAYTETLDVINYIGFEIDYGPEWGGRRHLGKLRDHAFLLAMEIKEAWLQKDDDLSS